MMKVGFRFAALAMALAALTCGTTRAAETWYDGFAIDDGDPGSATNYVSGVLEGQDGGSGSYFTGTWAKHPDAGGSNGVLPGSLDTPGLNPDPTGDRAGSSGDLWGCCYAQRTRKAYAANTIGVDGTVWMSFLANFGTGPNAVDPQFRMVEWWNGGFGDAALAMQIGVNSFGATVDELVLKVTGIDEAFGLPETHEIPLGVKFNQQQGRTHAIAIKFDFSTDDIEIGGTTGDSVSVYLDPTDLSDPGTPAASISAIDVHLDSMSAMSLFHFQGVQANPGGFDELRVGDTWADVALVVPEPATLSLIGLGLIGVVASARRKRG